MNILRLPLIGAAIATGAIGLNLADEQTDRQPIDKSFFADDPSAVAAGYGGAEYRGSLFGGANISAAEKLPNLSHLAPMGFGVGGFTGIPELDALTTRGMVTLPAMMSALRASSQRLQSVAGPSGVGESLLRCLGNIEHPSCGGIRFEIEALHDEMLGLSQDLLFGAK